MIDLPECPICGRETDETGFCEYCQEHKGKIRVEVGAAEALDELWNEVIAERCPEYDNYRYPIQAVNDILDAFRHLQKKVDELQSQLDAIKQEPFYIEEKKCRGRKR